MDSPTSAYHGLMLARGLTPRLVPALLVALVVLTFIARTSMGFYWPVPLSTDEAQYLAWSYDLQAGYYSKPPAIAWVLATAHAVCPVPQASNLEACSRWLQPLAFLISSLAAMATTHLLTQSIRTALWAGLLLLSSPLATFYSQAATTDAWLLAWWSLGLLCLVAASRAHLLDGRLTDSRGVGDRINQPSAHRLVWWLACGLFLGLGLLTKYSMLLFAVAAFVFLLARRQLGQAGPWLALALALLTFLPNLLWNSDLGWPTLAHHADITVGQERSGLQPTKSLEWLASQFLVFSPLVFVAFLVASASQLRNLLQHRRLRIGRLGKTDPASHSSLPFLMSWLVLGVVFLQALLSRAHANWAAPALVGIVIGVAIGCHRAGNRTGEGRSSRSTIAGMGRTRLWIALVLWGSLSLNLLTNAALLAAPWAVPALGHAGSRATDPFVRLTGFKEVALVAGSAARAEGQLQLASADRALLASLAAYNPNLSVYADNPEGLIDNHWQLQHDLAKGTLSKNSRVLLLVMVDRQASSFGPLVAELSTRFDSVEPLASSQPDLADALERIVLAGRSERGVVGFWVSLRARD